VAAFLFRDAELQCPAPAGEAIAIDRALRELHPGASWNEVRRLVTTGKVSVDAAVVTESTTPVRSGATITLRLAAPARRRQPTAADWIVHVDAQLLVVNKPAGIASVPEHDEDESSLDRLLVAALRTRPGTSGGHLAVVHRIDKETSGLLVFARTTLARDHLKQQFRFHTTHRRYLALCVGTVQGGTFRTRLVKDRGDGKRGSTSNSQIGREAVTHVRVLQTSERASLVECRLETGRTHQIRVHLAEVGHPLYGEKVYVPRGMPLPPAPRLMLHAAELGFIHPATGESLRFVAPLPADIQQTALSLGLRPEST
jgi:23S rRNA pseudouridine1911/1915/1917 synthase